MNDDESQPTADTSSDKFTDPYELIDRFCEELREAIGRGQDKAIEPIFHKSPPQLRDRVLEELVAEEAQLRAKRGNQPQWTDYARRFPDRIEAAWKGYCHFDPMATIPRGMIVGVDQVKEGLPVTSSRSAASAKRALDSVDFGNYKFIEELGRGGMGVVYKAHQTKLNRTVALKMIRSGELASSLEIRRFQREAEAVARLDHPSIVPIYEVGEHDGQPWYSMGFIEGENLADKLADGPLSSEEAAKLMIKIAEAIAYANENGVIHRDLKPANVLMDSKGQPRVTDFGLAKRTEADSRMTATGQILGTPSFMPPEQAAGQTSEVDARADVYSLGAILYNLVTGRPPFLASTPMETLTQVLNEEPAPPRQLNLGIPRDVETICLKCLRKEPARRYQTASELAADLRRWLNHKPIVARPVTIAEKCWKWARRHPGVVRTIAAAIIVLLVGVWIARSRQEATRFQGLVDRLVSAEPSELPAIVTELNVNPKLAATYLSPLLSGDASNADEKRALLHARLATVARDPSLVEPLKEELLTAKVNYVMPIRQLLRPYADTLTNEFLGVFRNENQDKNRRFRAALALANYVPESEADSWTEQDLKFVAEQLVSSNAEVQPLLRETLRPMREKLLSEMEQFFSDAKATDARRLNAANAFADYAASDIGRLSQLLTVASPEQFRVLYPLVSENSTPEVIDDLAKIAATLPPEDLGSLERVLFGQRRANAAVTLLRLGELEKALNVFEMTDDPEALTQFIFRCRPRDVIVDSLLECLELVTNAPLDRLPKNTRYALLLALGEFMLDEIPKSRRDDLLAQLADWYANDPSSGVHGAAGWLLRQWGQNEIAQKVDRTPISYSPDREWFTLAITVNPKAQQEPDNDEAKAGSFSADPKGTEPTIYLDFTQLTPKKTFYYTFIVFPPGNYWIGSVEGEPERTTREIRHQVGLSRPFAILDREIMFEELIEFIPGITSYMQQYDSRPADAGFAVEWYTSVRFCGWLGVQMNLPEADQAYAAPDSLDEEQYPRETNPKAKWAPRNWPVELERPGFRLPTEAEWEVAARAGARTAYGYGSDVSLLSRFGWLPGNSGKHVHPPKKKHPSIRGLFDLHGNLFEWVHDWYDDYGSEPVTDPVGPLGGLDRGSRGGSFINDAASCRSAFRGTAPPVYRSSASGFRLALSLSGKSPEARKEKTEPEGGGTEGASAEQRSKMP